MRSATPMILALVLAAPAVRADDGKARPRGSSPGAAEAQRRHPRAGTGSGHRGGAYYGHRYGHRSYGYPYSYYGYGYWGRPYYGYGHGYGYGYGYRYYDRSGSVRLQVKPEETTVLVDGYYTGVVDDFDGIFQRLHVNPGRHVITLKLDGHRTKSFRVYVPYHHTLKIHHRMEPGSGEDLEDLGGGSDEPDRYAPPRDRPRYGEDEDRREEPPRREAQDWSGASGTLSLQVRPDDAAIYVDGVFRGTAAELSRLELPAGRHRVEVVRPGFRTWERDVELEEGGRVELEVELERPGV